MKKNNEPRKLVNMRLRADLVRWMRNESKLSGVTYTQVIEELLDEHGKAKFRERGIEVAAKHNRYVEANFSNAVQAFAETSKKKPSPASKRGVGRGKRAQAVLKNHPPKAL